MTSPSHRRVLATMTGAVAVLLLGAVGAWACTSNAQISLNASTGPPGMDVEVRGSEVSGGTVQVYWEPNGGERQLLFETTGREFAERTTIPEGAAAGTHYLKAYAYDSDTDSELRGEATAAFTVPHGVIAGEVTDDGGEPVHAAEVTVARDGQPVGTGRTSSDGTFRVGDLERGEHEVTVDRDYYQRSSSQTHVEPAETSQLNFSLPREPDGSDDPEPEPQDSGGDESGSEPQGSQGAEPQGSTSPEPQGSQGAEPQGSEPAAEPQGSEPAEPDESQESTEDGSPETDSGEAESPASDESATRDNEPTSEPEPVEDEPTANEPVPNEPAADTAEPAEPETPPQPEAPAEPTDNEAGQDVSAAPAPTEPEPAAQASSGEADESAGTGDEPAAEDESAVTEKSDESGEDAVPWWATPSENRGGELPTAEDTGADREPAASAQAEAAELWSGADPSGDEEAAMASADGSVGGGQPAGVGQQLTVAAGLLGAGLVVLAGGSVVAARRQYQPVAAQRRRR